MFEKILEWIRKVTARMFQNNDVKRAFRVDVAISGGMTEALRLWSRMYVNNAPWMGEDGIVSLQLPAAIAGELATLTALEMKVEITGSARADYLAEQVKPLLGKIRTYLEYGNAKGGVVFKPYQVGNVLAIDCVQADNFYPVAFDSSGNMTGVIFADQRAINGKYYTRLEYHDLRDGVCTIQNMAFRSDNPDTLGGEVPLTAVPAWAELAPRADIENVTAPLYGYYKFPLANNIDPSYPGGVSCYARAVDLVEQADRLFSNLVWEFESGKRAIDVDELAFERDKDGRVSIPNRRLYRTYRNAGDVGKGMLFSEWSPEFREAALNNGLNSVLKRIEYTTGLAYGTLSDPSTVDKTATEIKSSRQRTYATVTDCQKALQTALDGLLYAMDSWATMANLAPRGTYAATYSFDDSVITDKDLQFANDLQLLDRVMSRVEFRMRNFGETEEVAREKLALIEPVTTGFFGA